MKKISSEDREVLLTLSILKTTMEVLMKTIQEAVDAFKAVKDAQDAENVKLAQFFTEVQNAFNRLEAKLATGVDAQAIVDALAPIKQSFVDNAATLDTKTAEAQLEGQ